MNYIKEIEAFEDWLEINHLPTTAQLLWYKLFVLCNRAGWAEWLSVTNQALMAKIGASSEKTLIEARNRLKQAELIDFKPGKKGQPTKYKLFSVEEILQKIHCKKYSVNNEVFSAVQDTVYPTVKTTVKSADIYKHKQETETDINNNSISNEIVSADADSPSSNLHQQQKEKIPYQRIVEMYNSICVSLPKVEQITEKRRRHIRVAWKNFKDDLTKFEEVFRRAEESDFLTGRNGRWTGCNFDWLVTYNNMVKVLEGTYSNKAMGGYSDGRNSQYRRSDEKGKPTGAYDKFYE